MPELNVLNIAFLVLIGMAFLLYMISSARFENAEVLEVLDGDTLRVATHKYKKGVKLRLIGIDCLEETGNFLRKDERYAREAARFMEEKLRPHTRIYLEYDQQKWDQYGRLLAYVYMSKSGKSINAELVKRGLAFAKPHHRNRKHEKLFGQLESQAQRFRLGLWQHYSPK